MQEICSLFFCKTPVNVRLCYFRVGIAIDMDLQLQAVIFDLDGVVINSEPIIGPAYAQLITELLKDYHYTIEVTQEDLILLSGRNTLDKFYLLGQTKGFDASSLEQEFLNRRKAMRSKIFEHKKPAFGKGLLSLTSFLQGRFAIASNKKKEEIILNLEQVGLSDNFKIVTGICPPKVLAKPKPDIILQSVDKLREHFRSLTNIAYVGDNDVDMRAADAAGVVPIGFLPMGSRSEQKKILEQNGASLVIDDLAALKDYCRDLTV